MPGVEGVAADAGEVFGHSVVLPEAAAGDGVPEREKGWAVEGGEGEGAGRAGADPAEVLDAELGLVAGEGFGGEEEHDGAGSKVPEGDPALAVSGGEEEAGGGVVVGEVGGEGGVGGEAERGDEGGEGGRGGGGHGEEEDELHGAGVDDGDAAAGAVGEEAVGAAVGAPAVAPAGGPREHAVPAVVGAARGRHGAGEVAGEAIREVRGSGSPAGR